MWRNPTGELAYLYCPGCGYKVEVKNRTVNWDEFTIDTALIHHDPPPTKEQLETMLRVTGARDQLAQTMANFKVSISSQLLLSEKETDEMFEDIDIEKLLAVSVDIYQKHFTAHEVDALIDFYTSSVGQSFIRKIVPVNQEIYRACQKLFNIEPPKQHGTEQN